MNMYYPFKQWIEDYEYNTGKEPYCFIFQKVQILPFVILILPMVSSFAFFVFFALIMSMVSPFAKPFPFIHQLLLQ